MYVCMYVWKETNYCPNVTLLRKLLYFVDSDGGQVQDRIVNKKINHFIFYKIYEYTLKIYFIYFSASWLPLVNLGKNR